MSGAARAGAGGLSRRRFAGILERARAIGFNPRFYWNSQRRAV
jgi:hypothetical protein